MVVKQIIAVSFLVMSMSGCATTGTWMPNDPSSKTQEKMNQEMQQCIAYADQTLNSNGALPILNMSIRNSQVEECMKRLGYHKAEAPSAAQVDTGPK